MMHYSVMTQAYCHVHIVEKEKVMNEGVLQLLAKFGTNLIQEEGKNSLVSTIL